MWNAVAVGLVSLICGGILGITLGFSAASHRDVMSGFKPKTNNHFILFLVRPTSEMRGLEAIAFLILMLVWVVAFFALAALPAVVSQKLTGDGPPLIVPAYIFAAVAWWVGGRLGARAWSNML